jgi:hypothetical protein
MKINHEETKRTKIRRERRKDQKKPSLSSFLRG